MAFNRQAVRIYLYGELAGPSEKSMGTPKFAGADREQFCRVLAGCIDPTAWPEAVIPWTDVHEIKGGNWVLWFKLAREVAIASDNGKRRTLNETRVNLHWATRTVELRASKRPARPDESDRQWDRVRTLRLQPARAIHDRKARGSKRSHQATERVVQRRLVNFTSRELPTTEPRKYEGTKPLHSQVIVSGFSRTVRHGG